MKKIVVIASFVIALATAVEGAPIYAAGNECPTDAQMTSNNTYTRQYYVTQALACVYDPASNNITGTQTEANTYLNVLGGGWTGLGENPTGFTFTTDAGNDDGTFTFSAPLTTTYNQFALGIKDGSLPFWAIFALPAGVTTGDWGFSTSGGDLSHFAVYGHTGTVVINPNCPLGGCPPDDDPPDDDPTAVPEPLSLLMLGAGLIGGKVVHNKKKKPIVIA